jgi:hypothetical protein
MLLRDLLLSRQHVVLNSTQLTMKLFICTASCLQACPEQQLCRLLSKLTKGCTPGSQDLAALAANPHLVAVLVRCCSPADSKTCKRALQVGVGLSASCSVTAAEVLCGCLWQGPRVLLDVQALRHTSQCADVLVNALTAVCQHVHESAHKRLQ